eukprot:scaffold47277_cov40-Phaeocystis_antarctica.AAC.1
MNWPLAARQNAPFSSCATPKSPQKNARASARFHPPAAAKKGNLQITNTSPPVNLRGTAQSIAERGCSRSRAALRLMRPRP